MKLDLLLDMAAFRQETGEPVRCPALERLLVRGDFAPPPGTSFQACLLGCFNVPAADPPLAALTLLADGMAPEKYYWLRADPVCLQATQTRLLLAPLPEDDLSAEAARALAARIHPHIAAAGHELIVRHPQRWYIRCERAQRLHTQSPLAASGLLTEDRMPCGEDGPFWRRLMTESQMLLYQHEVNDEREAQGKLPVNGIWLWGGGCMRPVTESRYAYVYSDELLAQGLARAASAPARPAPPRMEAVFEEADRQGDVLVACRALPQELGPDALARAWISPLIAQLRHGALAELRVLIADDTRPTSARVVRRAHLRRFWRRAQPL